MYTERYLIDLTIRMAHHSTAIEGNTLSLEEAKAILLQGIVPSRTVKLHEVYEIDNYRRLLPYLKEHAIECKDEPVSSQTIKDINGILMQNIDARCGKFKTAENIILGANFLPTHPAQVPAAIFQWCDNLQYRLSLAETGEEKTAVLMEQHLKFEHIHPFADGNGRTGRALLIYSCLQMNLPAIVIEKEQRDQYISLMNDEDVSGLCQLAHELQAKEIIRKEAYDREGKAQSVNVRMKQEKPIEDNDKAR